MSLAHLLRRSKYMNPFPSLKRSIYLNFQPAFRFYHEISYEQTGNPSEVLRYHQTSDSDDPELNSPKDHVCVNFLYSSLNPADLNTVEGTYPSPFSPPSSNPVLNFQKSQYVPNKIVGGSEAVGYVTHSTCPNFQTGDFVIPKYPQMGTWRSRIFAPSSLFLRVPPSSSGKELDPLKACTMSVNPCTAYRLLRDFIPLESGNVVIQNGGASAVGLMISQLSSLQNVKCISIVRRGNRSPEEFEQLCQYLETTGRNALVLEEEELFNNGNKINPKTKIQDITDGKLPCIAFNCIGGESASMLMKLLQPSGCMITYGGMSKLPVEISTGQFIFKDLKLYGYWHSRWMVQEEHELERQNMMQWIVDKVVEEELILGDVKVFQLKDGKDAIVWNKEGRDKGEGVRRKVVFKCIEE